MRYEDTQTLKTSLVQFPLGISFAITGHRSRSYAAPPVDSDVEPGSTRCDACSDYFGIKDVVKVRLFDESEVWQVWPGDKAIELFSPRRMGLQMRSRVIQPKSKMKASSRPTELLATGLSFRQIASAAIEGRFSRGDVYNTAQSYVRDCPPDAVGTAGVKLGFLLWLQMCPVLVRET
ncbi:hypothetical protein NDN08_005520 [Rhodosorus marinus]|uniref:Uncharacterized protein n=1 Tax=Rhodosorus marinus TaxID=101924 RepID=A0AAV8V5B3_9RHOD|nr:hypothetical protein NDN08_005520 [Rhodosorus marinus]